MPSASDKLTETVKKIWNWAKIKTVFHFFIVLVTQLPSALPWIVVVFLPDILFIAEWNFRAACIPPYPEEINDHLSFKTHIVPYNSLQPNCRSIMQRAAVTWCTSPCCAQRGSSVTSVLLSLPWLQHKPRSPSRARFISAKSHVKQGEAVRQIFSRSEQSKTEQEKMLLVQTQICDNSWHPAAVANMWLKEL